ncbi:response regulator [uncultured Sunxiuqinia sp.]|uniref:response regulator n=1 Tax=uncultured Sunxiuqinia sp. TaxID=1573825 RepID=UPI002AA7F046|nr:response regulator [uncultured Sunxiuqinia sp.]
MTKAVNDGGVINSNGWRLFKIIVIDDDDGLNHLIQKRLKREGFLTGSASSGAEAVDKITGAENELLLIDYKLPDMNGLQLIECLKQKLPQVPDFIAMTGYGDERVAVDMMRIGAREYLIKEADFITILPEKIKRICIDIETDRKLSETEKELTQSLDYLNEIGKIARVGGWELDIAANTVLWTEVTKEIHEVPSDYMPTLEEALDFFPKGSRCVLEKGIRNAIDEGVGYNQELPLITANGRQIWIHTICKPIIEAGRCVRLRGTFQDITSRKVAEENLKKSEARLKRTEKIAKVGSWEWVVATDTVTWSEELFRIFQLDPKHGAPSFAEHAKMYSSESLNLLSKAVERAVNEGVSYEEDLVLVLCNGKRVNCAVKGFARKDRNGKVVGLYGSFQDITDYKNFEAQLNDQKLLFETMFNAIEDGIIVSDTSRKIILANHGMKITFGYTSEEIIGKTTKILYANEQKYKEAGLMVFDKDGKNSDQFFVTDFRDKNNHVFPGEIFGKKLFNTEGKWIGNLGMMRNVTERLEDIEELRRAKEKAEESDRLKSAFLANMSHEIRTPMNGILGFTSLLQHQELSGEDQKQFLEIIMQSGNRLLETVNDLMDISKIETGLMEVSLEEMNVKKEINQLCDFFTEEASRKGLNLRFNSLLSSDEEIIETDVKKFISIITNLVKNAIKYTEEGFIEIKIEKKEGKLLCQVTDTGIGIPIEKQQAVFERFIQGDIATKRAYEGSGLGLSIAKAYVQMLNGEIGVKSEEEKGSTFYFFIPLKNTKTNDVQIKDNAVVGMSGADNKNLKILIAEDDSASSQYLSILLKNLSTEIIYATNGVQAIELVKNNTDIDLIMMDIQMPEKNGYEATKEIREFNKDVVIVAQTAFAMEGDREKSLAAGCNDYISKPIKKDLLVDLIHRLF